MKRGQLTIEFLFALGTTLFIFLLLLAFAFDKNLEINELEKTVDLKDTCGDLVISIMAAFIHGNGTTIERSLNFNVSTIPTSRLIMIDNSVTCRVPINQISQTDTIKGNIIIENQNSIISIKNA